MRLKKLQQMRHGSTCSAVLEPPWHLGCNPFLRRHLATALARLGLTIGVPALVAGALFTSRTITATQLPHPVPFAVAPAANDAPLDHRPGDEGGVVDLYGNEVSDAIATYSIDPAGSLYELHSPQTEVPRLGSPKS